MPAVGKLLGSDDSVGAGAFLERFWQELKQSKRHEIVMGKNGEAFIGFIPIKEEPYCKVEAC